MAQRGIDGSAQLIDPHRRAEQPIEQRVDTRASGTGVRTNGIADIRTRLPRRARAECDHGAGRVGTAQRVERSAPCRRVIDHHCGQRLTERRLDSGLPPGIDLDQVEQGPEHPVDTGETFGSRTSPSSVECELERFHPGRATRSFLSSIVAQRLARLVAGDGLGEGRLGQFHFADERLFDGSRLVAFGPEPHRTFRRRIPLRCERLEAFAESTKIARGPFERRTDRAQLAANFGGSTGRLRTGLVGTDCLHHLRAFDAEASPRRRAGSPMPVRSPRAPPRRRRVRPEIELHRPRGWQPRRRRAAGPCRAPTIGDVRPGPRRALAHVHGVARRAPAGR